MNFRPELTFETGADGKPQSLIPGTEQISQGLLVQRKSDEKLKPRVAQLPLEHGLFGDEAKQGQLF